MKTTVEIEWDEPQEQAWLRADNISLALHTYCKNTKFKVREIAALRAAEQPARYACKMSGGCAHSIKCHSQGRCEYESTPAPAQQPSRDAVLENLAKSYELSASLNSISLLAEAQRNFAAQLRALKAQPANRTAATLTDAEAIEIEQPSLVAVPRMTTAVASSRSIKEPA